MLYAYCRHDRLCIEAYRTLANLKLRSRSESRRLATQNVVIYQCGLLQISFTPVNHQQECDRLIGARTLHIGPKDVCLGRTKDGM